MTAHETAVERLAEIFIETGASDRMDCDAKEYASDLLRELGLVAIDRELAAAYRAEMHQQMTVTGVPPSTEELQVSPTELVICVAVLEQLRGGQ